MITFLIIVAALVWSLIGVGCLMATPETEVNKLSKWVHIVAFTLAGPLIWGLCLAYGIHWLWKKCSLTTFVKNMFYKHEHRPKVIEARRIAAAELSNTFAGHTARSLNEAYITGRQSYTVAPTTTTGSQGLIVTNTRMNVNNPRNEPGPAELGEQVAARANARRASQMSNPAPQAEQDYMDDDWTVGPGLLHPPDGYGRLVNNPPTPIIETPVIEPGPRQIKLE